MQNNITLQVGVKILIQNKDGKYLLLRRSLEKYPETSDNRWSIVGGRINPGETLIDNLRREVREETGLELVGEPQLIAAQDILNIEGYPDRHVVRLTYIGKASGDIALDTEENDMHQWFLKEELMQLKGLDLYLQKILSYIK
jgi:8-oxo-dGTP diphosphatase